MSRKTVGEAFLAAMFLLLVAHAIVSRSASEVEDREILVPQGDSPGWVEESELWEDRIERGCKVIDDDWVCPPIFGEGTGESYEVEEGL
tara:strand:- start:7533 stop:7799 length:267 start_codon:yes stop_codon:yes gene_type:complete